MNCQECKNRPGTGILHNLSGYIKLVCDECAKEIREKQIAFWIGKFGLLQLYIGGNPNEPTN